MMILNSIAILGSMTMPWPIVVCGSMATKVLLNLWSCLWAYSWAWPYSRGLVVVSLPGNPNLPIEELRVSSGFFFCIFWFPHFLVSFFVFVNTLALSWLVLLVLRTMTKYILCAYLVFSFEDSHIIVFGSGFRRRLFAWGRRLRSGTLNAFEVEFLVEWL